MNILPRLKFLNTITPFTPLAFFLIKSFTTNKIYLHGACIGFEPESPIYIRKWTWNAGNVMRMLLGLLVPEDEGTSVTLHTSRHGVRSQKTWIFNRTFVSPNVMKYMASLFPQLSKLFLYKTRTGWNLIKTVCARSQQHFFPRLWTARQITAVSL